MWTQVEALRLCRIVEPVASEYGFHVALTGGCLYKSGPRKDLDLLFYRVRQQRDSTMPEDALRMLYRFRRIGLQTVDPTFKWCVKASLNGRVVDLFFPDAASGDHLSGVEIETDETECGTVESSVIA